MKNLISIIALTLIFSCCSKKDDEQPTILVDQLPPATQTGANKVGCLVNGKVILPYQKNPFGVPAVVCFYQNLNNSFEFGLGVNNDKDGVKGISILTNKQVFIEGQTYILKQEENLNSSYAYYNLGLSYYGTNTINTGELKITKLDQVNAIISGTFWFDAVNSAGAKVEVRDGRFDMQYSQ